MASRDLLRRAAVPAVLLFSLTAGGVAMCGLPGDTLEDDREGILGTYVVNGADPSEVEYSGTVTIAEGDAPGEYAVQWIITGAIQEGTGVLDGDVFLVEWRTVSGGRGESGGTGEYTVGTDGVLRGTRTVAGVDDIGTEEIFPEP